MAGTKGMGKGNTNASLAPTQRHRVKFDASLSGKRLTHFEQIAYQEHGRIPTDKEIETVARRMFYEWVGTLLKEG